MDERIQVAAPGDPTAATELLRWRSGRGIVANQDILVREEPLEIRIQGRCVAVTMRTPGHDAELAAGFLLSEGLVQQPKDILEIAHCRRSDPETEPNILNVFLAPNIPVDFEKLSRHVFASSSCGLCGKTSIESVRQHFPPLQTQGATHADILLGFPIRLRASQVAFAQTGGLHAAAIFGAEGQLIVAREDVGRHNAVDKVIGHILQKGLRPVEPGILMVSGRASFEIVQKALAARLPIVAAISAPSTLAVEFARDNGQTLIGFLRGDSMNVYSGPQRILGLD